jgi:hypothetical protein
VPGRRLVPIKDPIEVAFISVEEGPVLTKAEYLFWRPRSFLERFRDFLDRFFEALRRILGEVSFVLKGATEDISTKKNTARFNGRHPEESEGRRRISSVQILRFAQDDKGDHVGAVVAASSSPVHEGSLNDEVWLGYFEQHPEKAMVLIKEAIRQDNIAALAVIQRNQPQYPQLNLLIEQNLKQVALK